MSPIRLINLASISLVYGREKTNKTSTGVKMSNVLSKKKKKKGSKDKEEKRQPVGVEAMIWNSVLF